MQLGMIGLGRMGSNMVRRLIGGGHQCVVFDVSPKAVAADEWGCLGFERGQGKLLSAMRYELGGHLEKPAGQ